MDAGGDLVALAAPAGPDAASMVAAQWTYDAYGKVVTADHLSAHAFAHLGSKGLFVDRLDGAVTGEGMAGSGGGEAPRLAVFGETYAHNRARVVLGAGRYGQPDPNATGMVLPETVAHGGAAPAASVQGVSVEDRYADGANLYQYLGSNPWIHNDPFGLFVGLFVPDPGDMITGALRSLVTDYAANLDWDLDWASDWSMDDVANTRESNEWVNHALAWGVYDAFEIDGWNPLDTAYDLMGGSYGKRYRPGDANAPRFPRFKNKNNARLAAGAGPYGHLKDPPGVAPNKDFSPSQRTAFMDENKANNGGMLRSDVTGRYLARSRGSPNSAEVDHIIPKSMGGSNSYKNAQLVESYWNKSKGSR